MFSEIDKAFSNPYAKMFNYDTFMLSHFSNVLFCIVILDCFPSKNTGPKILHTLFQLLAYHLLILVAISSWNLHKFKNKRRGFSSSLEVSFKLKYLLCILKVLEQCQKMQTLFNINKNLSNSRMMNALSLFSIGYLGVLKYQKVSSDYQNSSGSNIESLQVVFKCQF